MIEMAQAMREAAAIQAAQRAGAEDLQRHFLSCWDQFKSGGKRVYLPTDFASAIEHFFAAGLEPEVLSYAVRTAMENTRLTNGDVFKYFCGICWRVIRERQGIAATISAHKAAATGTTP